MLALIASPNVKRSHSSSRVERRRNRDVISPPSSDDDVTFERMRSHKSSEDLAGGARRSPRGSPRSTPTRDLRRRSSGDSSDRGRLSSDSTDRGRQLSDSSERGAVYVECVERGRYPSDPTKHCRHSSDSSDKSVRVSESTRDRTRHSDKGRHQMEPSEKGNYMSDLEAWRQNSIDKGRRSSDSDRDRRLLAEIQPIPVKERLERRRSGPADMRHRRHERRTSDKIKAHASDVDNTAPAPPSRQGSTRLGQGRARYSLTQIDERHSGDSVLVSERESPRRGRRNLQPQISIEETDENGECIKVETIAMAERARALQRHRSPRRSLPTPPTAKTLARVKVHHANSLNLEHEPPNLDQGHRAASPLLNQRYEQ